MHQYNDQFVLMSTHLDLYILSELAVNYLKFMLVYTAGPDGVPKFVTTLLTILKSVTRYFTI